MSTTCGLAAAGFLEARLRLALVAELNLIPDCDAARRRMLPREVDWRGAPPASGPP